MYNCPRIVYEKPSKKEKSFANMAENHAKVKKSITKTVRHFDEKLNSNFHFYGGRKL